MAQVVNVTPASQVSQVEINNRQLNVVVQKEVKSVDVTLETRGDIGVEISRAVSQTGVQNIIGGADISVSNVAGNVTVSFAPDGFTSTGNITAPYFLGNVIGNIVGNIVVPGANTDVLYNNQGNIGANSNFQYNSANATLTVTGNIVATNISGNGSGLSSIAGANITGTVANATHATVSNSANTVAGANVTGTVANATYATTAGSATTAGTVTTNAQPNITSVGTLTNLDVTANVTAGNIKSDNLLYSNGSPYVFTTNAAGTNTQVQFNDNNSFAGSSTFTFNKTTGLVTASGFSGNGAPLTNITGANVTGTVANATHASTANTVTNSVQPNITSVGVLSGLSIAGSIIPTSNIAYDLGNTTNRFRDIYLSGNTIYLGSAEITADGTDVVLPSANIAGDINTTGNANITQNLNVSGNAIISGNLTVNGNTYYTNVETLVVEDPIIEQGGGPNGAPLTENDGKDRGELLHYYTTEPVDAFMGWDNSGSEFIFGSNVTNTSEVISVNTYGNIRAQHILATIDGANVSGEVASASYATSAGDALVAGEAYSVAVANVVGIGDIATINLNMNPATVLFGDGVWGGIPTTDANYANYAGNVVNAAQPNITSVGTLTSVTSSGTVTGTNLISTVATGTAPLTVTSTTEVANLNAYRAGYVNTISTGSNFQLAFIGGTVNTGSGNIANLAYNTNIRANTTTGTISANRFTSTVTTGTAPFTVTSTTQVANLNVATAGVAGTVTTADQPNITSVGTLNGLTVTGNIQSDLVRTNVLYTRNGNKVADLQDGLGKGIIGLQNDLYFGMSGTGNLIFSGSGGSSLVYLETVSNISLGDVSNIHIQGGTSGQVLSTDGLGNLSWVTGGGGGGGTPGGLNTQLQFNDSGSFGGISTVTYDGTNLSLGSVNNVKMTGGSSNLFVRTDGTGNLSFQAITSNLTVATRTVATNITISNYQMNVEARGGNVTVNVN